MALSTYFETPTLRAVDEAAANINQPLSSTLEAQLASSHEWLHRRAGGAVAMLKCPGGTTLSGHNKTFQVSAVWSSLFMTPFLVTRGLTQIKVSFYGTVQSYDSSMRLELQGFGQVDATWSTGGAINIYHTITLNLEQPSEYEYETDLILWGKTQLISTVGVPYTVQYTDGVATMKPAALTTLGPATLVASGTKWVSSGFEIQTLRETLFRNPSGVVPGGTSGVAIMHERMGGAEEAGQLEICRITPRAFFIETRST